MNRLSSRILTGLVVVFLLCVALVIASLTRSVALAGMPAAALFGIGILLLLDLRRRAQEIAALLRKMSASDLALERRVRSLERDVHETRGRATLDAQRLEQLEMRVSEMHTDFRGRAEDGLELVTSVSKDLQRLSEAGSEAMSSLTRTLGAIRYEPVGEVSALLTLHLRFRPRAALDAHAASAMSPSTVARLVDVIDAEQPELVVECGSGLSTIWMGYALAEVGRGRLVALEHHDRFLQRTRQMVEAHGLGDVVEVRRAPLGPVESASGSYTWYTTNFADLRDIGLLVVDGPPGNVGPLARFPAIPVLGSQLISGALVVLDDAARDAERETAKKWTSGPYHLEATDEFADRSASFRFRGATAPQPPRA